MNFVKYGIERKKYSYKDEYLYMSIKFFLNIFWCFQKMDEHIYLKLY